MSDTKLCSRTLTRTHEVSRNFAVRDSKYRQLSATAYCGTVIFEEKEEGATYGFPMPADEIGKTRFFFQPDSRRDGKSFGAYHRERHFSTAAERDAAVAKYLDGAHKRALKVK